MTDSPRNMEPGARLDHLSARDAALESIAISLKRIADQVEGEDSRPGMIEMMSYIAENVMGLRQ